MKSLIAKELRENLKWLLVGLAIMLVLTWMGLPKQIEDAHKLSEYLGFAGALFAIFLGVVQTAWDFSDRQQGFLLHRSASKNQIILSKIAAGSIAYSMVMSIPLLFATTYFVVMGPEYLPIRPLQLSGTTFLVIACYSLHPVTLLAMIRPAKWYGTKVLPLVLPAFICFFSCISYSHTRVYWIAAGVMSLMLISLVLSSFYQRAQTITLALNALAAAMIAVGFYGTLLESIKDYNSRSNSTRFAEMFGIDQDGSVWKYRWRQVYDSQGFMKTEYVSGSHISSGHEIDMDGRLPNDFSPNGFVHLAPFADHPYSHDAIQSVRNASGMFWDQGGYLLKYDLAKSPPLSGTITRDGFSPGSEPVGTRFMSNPVGRLQQVGWTGDYANSLGPSFFVADSNGVYVLNRVSGQLVVVIDKPIEDAFALNGKEFSNQFFIDTGKAWERYEVHHEASDAKSHSTVLPEPKDITISNIATYPKLPHADAVWSLAVSNNGKLAALAIEATQYRVATLSSPEQTEWLVQTVELPRGSYIADPAYPAVLVYGFIPIALAEVLFVAASRATIMHDGILGVLESFAEADAREVVLVCGMVFIVANIVTACVLYFVLRRRFTDRRNFLVWFALIPVLGIATPLAVVAIYPRLTFDKCPRCDRKRRVDRNKCEHCGSRWEQLASQGVEILEHQRFHDLSTAG